MGKFELIPPIVNIFVLEGGGSEVVRGDGNGDVAPHYKFINNFAKSANSHPQLLVFDVSGESVALIQQSVSSIWVGK